MYIIICLQIIGVVCAARVAGKLFQWMGQPAVIGEIAAGVMLGPTLFGRLAPQLSVQLFPPATLPTLEFVSQLGVLLFVFLLGSELETGLFRASRRAVINVTNAGIALSMALVGGVAFWMWPAELGGAGQRLASSLFLAVAAGMTALPVLARMIRDQGLLRSRLGQLAIACAVLNDALTWLLLSLLLLFLAPQAGSGWVALLGVIAYPAVMATLGRRAASYLAQGLVGATSDEQKNRMLGLCLLFVTASALISDWLGLHLLVGALAAGLVFAREHAAVAILRSSLQGVANLLLPVFFMLVGLKTDLVLAFSGAAQMLALAIVFASVIGKIGGAWLVTRWSGLGWKDTVSLGVLLNTRGMMELVILTVGMDLHLIGQLHFSAMVAMTISTTLMTGLLLPLIRPGMLRQQELPGALATARG